MKLTLTRTVLLVALVLLECCFLFAAFSGSHLDRPPTARAFIEWRRHPSPQTEAAWVAERRKHLTEQAMIDGTIWLMIIGTGAGIYYVARGQKRQTSGLSQ